MINEILQKDSKFGHNYIKLLTESSTLQFQCGFLQFLALKVSSDLLEAMKISLMTKIEPTKSTC